MPAVTLRVLSGSQSGSAIPLVEGKFIIGREHDCQLRPNSELVSRHHCVFTVDAFAVRLRDLGSTNGTFLNGERIRGTAVLKPGDRVLVGKLEVQVVIDGQPATVSEETIHARRDETIVAGKAAAPVTAASDSGFDVAVMSDALAALEDETGIESVAASPTGTVVLSPPEPAEVGALVPANGAAAEAAPGYPPGAWMPPPAYPYPPAYPQYPGVPPYGYGYPYPGMPPMPGMPQYPPGYGYPAPPAAAPAATEAAPSPAANEFPEFRLPDPATTGAKAPPPPAPPKPEESGKPKAHIPTAAQDIINSYLNRRPKT